jgi:hypothetical protein
MKGCVILTENGSTIRGKKKNTSEVHTKFFLLPGLNLKKANNYYLLYKMIKLYFIFERIITFYRRV